MVRGEELCYLELIGLTYIQLYTTLRVLRQFGQIQWVLFIANMRVSEYDFGPRILQVHDIMRRWGKAIIIGLHGYHPDITPECFFMDFKRSYGD